MDRIFKRIEHPGAHLGFEEVLGSVDADLVHVDLELLGEHAEAGVLGQFAGGGLAKDQKELAERNVAVEILVNFLKCIMLVEMGHVGLCV